MKMYLVIVAVTVVVFVVLTVIIINRVRASAVEEVYYAELKVCYGNLKKGANFGKIDAHLMEYLKARDYYLITEVTPQRGRDLAVDFGPVDLEKIQHVSLGKGPVSASESYKRFQTTYGLENRLKP